MRNSIWIFSALVGLFMLAGCGKLSEQSSGSSSKPSTDPRVVGKWVVTNVERVSVFGSPLRHVPVAQFATSAPGPAAEMPAAPMEVRVSTEPAPRVPDPNDLLGTYSIYKADGTFQDYGQKGEFGGKGTWSVSGDTVQFHYEKTPGVDITNYNPINTLEKGKMVDRNTPGLVVYLEKVAPS